MQKGKVKRTTIQERAQATARQRRWRQNVKRSQIVLAVPIGPADVSMIAGLEHLTEMQTRDRRLLAAGASSALKLLRTKLQNKP